MDGRKMVRDERCLDCKNAVCVSTQPQGIEMVRHLLRVPPHPPLHDNHHRHHAPLHQQLTSPQHLG